MKLVENFVGVVDKVKYNSFENKNKKEDAAPILYVCNATIIEVGRGMAKFPQKHNVVFFLTEEQFNQIDENGSHSVIEKGDRINILEESKWQGKKLDYVSYNPEVIANADKSMLKTNENGQKYYKESVWAYKLICKPENWSINTKWYDQNYCTIKGSGLKLPLMAKSDFSSDKLDFFLDENEVKKIIGLNGRIQPVVAYSNKNKFSEKNMEVYIEIDDKAKTNYLLLTEVADAFDN